MVVWKLKSCPRCGGDLYIDRDIDSWFAQCLQCSHWRELGNSSKAQKLPVAIGAQAQEKQPVA